MIYILNFQVDIYKISKIQCLQKSIPSLKLPSVLCQIKYFGNLFSENTIPTMYVLKFMLSKPLTCQKKLINK